MVVRLSSLRRLSTLGVSHMKAMSGDNREVACNNLGDDDNDDDNSHHRHREKGGISKQQFENCERFRLVLIFTISEIVGLLVMVQQPWSVGSVGRCETSTESLISCSGFLTISLSLSLVGDVWLLQTVGRGGIQWQ